MRHFPITHVKIRWDPPADSDEVAVAVLYPSYRLNGEIKRKDVEKLINFGRHTGVEVRTGEDNFARMVLFTQDLKYGKPKEADDEVMKNLRKVFSQTPNSPAPVDGETVGPRRRYPMNLTQLRAFVRYPLPTNPGGFPKELRLYADRTLEVFYVPVEHLNRKARLILLGLTPGFHQAQLAFEAFAAATASGASVPKALASAKHSAAFAGSMRTNLCAMLDAIGLPVRLGVADASALFAPPQPLVHLTSALRYPVFKLGRNYSGSPAPTRHPELRRMIESILASELEAIAGALVVPLGKAAQSATDHLISRDQLDPARVLRGFPHPSGANGHRKREFALNLPLLRSQVACWFERDAV